MSTFRLYFLALFFSVFFSAFFFGCNNDRLFPEKYTVKDHISNTKLEKGDHYYVQTRHKDILSWASYSTPYIEF